MNNKKGKVYKSFIMKCSVLKEILSNSEPFIYSISKSMRKDLKSNSFDLINYLFQAKI